MDFIISLLLFIVALGVLVTIHELGHFIAAKSFNVFCSEFSIGFGPKIVKYKRKTGETRFCIGIIPLGGYVRMYGEESDDEDKDSEDYVNVPRERSLVGIKRWKRIIIMSAGIIMNFILAYIIFFISAISSPQLTNDAIINVVAITNEETFDENFKNSEGNLLTFEEKEFINQSFINFNTYQYTYTYTDIEGVTHEETLTLSNVGNAQNTLVNNEEADVVYLLDTSNYGYNDTDYSNCFKFYEGFTINSIPSEISNIKVLNGEEFVDLPNEFNYVIPLIKPNNGNYELVPVSENKNMDISLDIVFSKLINEETREYESRLFNATFHKDSLNNYEDLGLGMYANFEWLGWGAFGYAGKKWVDSTTLIADAIGQLFYNPDSWSNLGGPIAIFTQTTQILNNYPFSFYLETWGIISVNLALFNLLPFPGLDGWQILVEIVEGSVNAIKKGIWKVKQKKRKGNEPVLEGNVNPENSESNDKVVEIVGNNISDNNIEVIDNNEENNNKEVVDVTLKEEKYKEWEIPPKVKNIMSAIGLILLFALMFVIIIKDIVSLF